MEVTFSALKSHLDLWVLLLGHLEEPGMRLAESLLSFMMGTLFGECLCWALFPTFSRVFPWPAVRPSVLSRFSKCEGPNEAAWQWQQEDTTFSP